ncbi:MAG: FAD:protein FMN transferase, partial [Clostridia bacterium]|nr:FAD:protein FMN transferase [Clostridia bacterium]
MKRILCLFAALSILLTGCAAKKEQKQYTATFLELFDTVTTVIGFAQSEEEFSSQAQQAHDRLMEYHQLFDIYNEYEGAASLKTVNDNAGVAPVKVDGRIIDLLKDCRAYFGFTGGKVNAAMGSV